MVRKSSAFLDRLRAARRRLARSWPVVRKSSALLLLLLIAALLFRQELSGRGERLFAVVDITQSMNAQDTKGSSRLEATKGFLLRLVEQLPCGAELGVGIFTHREVLPLWRPVEVCRHGPALRLGIEAIDWRSAWAMDSYIGEGLREALAAAARFQARLLFLTDGDRYPQDQKTPELPKGEGWLIGVGSLAPSPIPRWENGRVVGFLRVRDLPVQFDPHLRERFRLQDPNRLVTTVLDEPYLRELANGSGLRYRRLSDRLAEEVAGEGRVGWLLLLALFLALLLA